MIGIPEPVTPVPAPRQRSKTSPGSDSEVKPTVIEVKSPYRGTIVTTNHNTEESENEDEVEERRSLKDLEQVDLLHKD